jgi:hypothetical protein
MFSPLQLLVFATLFPVFAFERVGVFRLFTLVAVLLNFVTSVHYDSTNVHSAPNCRHL